VSATRHVADGRGDRETAPVLEALIEGGLAVGLPVTGSSMTPTLHPGDRIVVAPFLGLPAPGQIVVARAAAGIVAHRLASVEMRDGRRLYRTQGDAENGLDAGVRREEIIGRVVEVIRGGRRTPVDDSPWARRRALFRLALRRRRPRLVRAAILMSGAALGATLGTAPPRAAIVTPSAEITYAPSSDYRFAPGDVLSLRVWDGEKIDEKQLTVQSDGTAFLPIPGLGSVPVGGLTPAEAKEEIEARLGRIYKEI
jgi:hypothetical protein